jgi:hypothetical protein
MQLDALLLDATRTYSNLLEPTRSYSKLLEVTRRYSDATRRYSIKLKQKLANSLKPNSTELEHSKVCTLDLYDILKGGNQLAKLQK